MLCNCSQIFLFTFQCTLVSYCEEVLERIKKLDLKTRMSNTIKSI